MKNEEESRTPAQPAARAWVRPELKSVGNVGDVLQAGGAKLSVAKTDPGDPRKPKGQG
jgi:hypothetical protein